MLPSGMYFFARKYTPINLAIIFTAKSAAKSPKEATIIVIEIFMPPTIKKLV
jgi:hypothetical protein